MAQFDFGTSNVANGGIPKTSMGPASGPQPQGAGGQGSNQYSPYGVGGFGFFNPSSMPQGPQNLNIGYGGIPQSPSAGKSGYPGYGIGSTQDPQLTSQFFNWLQSQIGQGMNPYPGQLTAPPNNILTSLQSLFTGGKSTSPALNSLQNMATTGNPTDVGPAWDAMVAAQQRNIAENANQMKEQYAFSGNLAGSPFANSLQDFYSQTALDQNSLLAQMQQQASEAAAGRELGAQGDILGAGLQGSGQLQNIQQQGLTNQYQEWLRTQPQYNPLLQYMYGAATTYPPYLQMPQQQSPWGGIAQGIGSILGHLPFA